MNLPKTGTTTLVIGMVVAAIVATATYAEAPTIDPADDPKHYGPWQKFLFWTPEQQVAGYRNINRIFPTRKIAAGGTAYPLGEAPKDLGGVSLSYKDTTMTVDEYFVRQNVAGLIVVKDGDVVYERYGLGNDRDSVWVSFSVAKSVVSMLVGAAIRDGYIESVDELITDYLPRLKRSSYDQSRIRDVLQMSSGVRWNEDYADPASDLNTTGWDTMSIYNYLGALPRDAQPGEKFNYNSAETNLVGTMLRSAIGNNLSTYLHEKIWRPFGMESDANWMLTEPGGGESGGCCISATLRDYARIGLFAMHDGVLPDGTKVLPEGWMEQSTRPSKGYEGYGYLWWLDGAGTFHGRGIFGQGIHIDPERRVVVALHSARAVASREIDRGLQYQLGMALAKAAAGE